MFWCGFYLVGGGGEWSDLVGVVRICSGLVGVLRRVWVRFLSGRGWWMVFGVGQVCSDLFGSVQGLVGVRRCGMSADASGNRVWRGRVVG